MNQGFYSFLKWSQFFKKNKWSILHAVERGNMGRTAFEMEVFEWPVFLQDLKSMRLFLQEFNLKKNKRLFYPKGNIQVEWTGVESLSSLFSKLFFPVYFGNQTTVQFHSSLSFLVDFLKTEFKNDFLFQKVHFKQWPSTDPFKSYTNKISISVWPEIQKKITFKEKQGLDHLLWAALYGLGAIEGSQKILFVPEPCVPGVYEQLTVLLDQQRAPFLDQSAFEHSPFYHSFHLFKKELIQDSNFKYSASVFHESFYIFSTQQFKNMINYQEFPYGPYLIVCGYRYLRNLVLQLNKWLQEHPQGAGFQSVAVMGDYGQDTERELQNIHTSFLSFDRHLLFEQYFSPAKLQELSFLYSHPKLEVKPSKVWQFLEVDRFQKWSYRKTGIDASRLKKAIPLVSRKLLKRFS